jgi:hypothetical protein
VDDLQVVAGQHGQQELRLKVDQGAGEQQPDPQQPRPGELAKLVTDDRAHAGTADPLVTSR